MPLTLGCDKVFMKLTSNVNHTCEKHMTFVMGAMMRNLSCFATLRQKAGHENTLKKAFFRKLLFCWLLSVISLGS